MSDDTDKNSFGRISRECVRRFLGHGLLNIMPGREGPWGMKGHLADTSRWAGTRTHICAARRKRSARGLVDEEHEFSECDGRDESPATAEQVMDDLRKAAVQQ